MANEFVSQTPQKLVDNGKSLKLVESSSLHLRSCSRILTDKLSQKLQASDRRVLHLQKAFQQSSHSKKYSHDAFSNTFNSV